VSKLLSGELQRARALVEISKLREADANAAAAGKGVSIPLVSRLSEYPSSGVVDLENIVVYPPKTEAVPVKPLFLDVAWNYIEYPGSQVKPAKSVSENKAEPEHEASKPQKKGWFGFGR
jgi:signal recognition particle subunit SRP68